MVKGCFKKTKRSDKSKNKRQFVGGGKENKGSVQEMKREEMRGGFRQKHRCRQDGTRLDFAWVNMK